MCDRRRELQRINRIKIKIDSRRLPASKEAVVESEHISLHCRITAINAWRKLLRKTYLTEINLVKLFSSLQFHTLLFTHSILLCEFVSFHLTKCLLYLRTVYHE